MQTKTWVGVHPLEEAACGFNRPAFHNQPFWLWCSSSVSRFVFCDRISHWPEIYQVGQTGLSVSLRDPTFLFYVDSRAETQLSIPTQQTHHGLCYLPSSKQILSVQKKFCVLQVALSHRPLTCELCAHTTSSCLYPSATVLV